MRHARSSEQESESPWKTRRARRRIRPIRVLEESVSVEPLTLTVQDASDLTGAVVRDCRPPLWPVSLKLRDIGPLLLRRLVASASLAAPPPEDSVVIGGASPERVAIPELGVAPSDDRGTDLEDELPTAVIPMLISDSSPEGSVCRMLVSHLRRTLIRNWRMTCSTYLLCLPPYHLRWSPRRFFQWLRLHIRSLLFLFSWTPLPMLGPDGPILDLFPTYLIFPTHSDYDPVTSPISPSLQEDSLHVVFLPPNSPATMDQYLLEDRDLLSGDAVDLPLLSLPLLPLPATDDSVPGSSVVSPAGEPVVVPSDMMPDLSREGPFDVHQDALKIVLR